MHTLAFVNQKGGCGKTTTAVHLAGALANKGRRVLLLDLDPQAHATLALSCAVVDGESSIGDVLQHGMPLARAIVEAPGRIALVPATVGLSEFEAVAERLVHPERVLDGALAKLEPGFDFVLVDCPPRADGVLTANALRAADTAVLVVETGAFALQGAIRALEVLEEVAGTMEAGFDVRVIGTLFDRRLRLGRDLLIAMQARFGPKMFDTVIHTSVRLREAAAAGAPIHLLDPGSASARDFEALAAEIEDHARLSRPVELLHLPVRGERWMP